MTHAENSMERDVATLEALTYELKKVIVGQDHVIERVLVGLLSDGHCLLEGLPGLAKTLLVRTLADAMGGAFSRIQFTPDLIPADIVGTRIYHASSGGFETELGPVFANFVLADEINRAPAKVQSALLEAMAERQVSIGHDTWELPQPFLVLATQNPIESDGVYRLPEAQRDRFLLHIDVGYPDEHDEVEIVRRAMGPATAVRRMIDLDRLGQLQAAARHVYVDPRTTADAVRIVCATREPEKAGYPELARLIESGAGPRASIGLVRAAQALALLRGRSYVHLGDLLELAPDVLRHRLVLSYEAIADGIRADDVIAHLLGRARATDQHADLSVVPA
jgi:MoxR-like ATPase